MRITILSQSLDCGGAERVCSLLANEWSKRGYKVTLITLLPNAPSGDFFPLGRNISRVSLACIPAQESLFRRIFKLPTQIATIRRAIINSNPDVVISFLNWVNVLTISAMTGIRSVPVICSERSDPFKEDSRLLTRLLCRQFYKHCNALVTVSPSAEQFYSSYVRNKIRFIPNPVLHPQKTSFPDQPCDSTGRMTLLAAGRLSNEKGFDILIETFGRLAPHNPLWDLCIIGEGPNRAILEKLRDGLKLKDRISLPGRTDDPGGYMARSHLFALTSRFEGFPNSLTEAMACGLPVVAFEGVGACSKIITNCHDGILVSPPGSPSALESALAWLMADSTIRCKLGAKASKIVDRYSLENVIQQWDDLIKSVRNT
mgnify:CR=1 FL=1